MGFFDTPGMQPQPNMLTPEMLQILMDEYGVPPETFLGGGLYDDSAMTVADTIEQPTDAMFPVEQSLDVAPDAAPQVGVNPPPERGLFGKILGGLGDNFSMERPMGQALMATGLGILGAQNTYGSFGSALGQGGMAGLVAHDRAKQRGNLDQAKKLQIEAQLEARKEARLRSRLETLQTVAKTNPEAANEMLARDKALQEFIPLLPGGTFRGAPGEGKVMSLPNGEIVAVTGDATSGYQYQQIKAPQPQDGPDPMSGAFREEKFNPQTGMNETWLFDKFGNPVTKVGEKPPSGGVQAQFDEEGRMVGFSVGGSGKMPSPVVTKAYDAVDASRTLENVVDNLSASLDQSNVGLVGDMRQLTMGALAQANAMPFARALQNTVSDVVKMANANGEKIDERTLADPQMSAVRVLGGTVSRLYAKMLDPGGKVSDSDARDAAKILGLDDRLVSVDDIKQRLAVIKDIARGQRERAESKIGSSREAMREGAAAPTAAAPAAPPPAKKKSKQERLNELVSELGDEKKAYLQLAREVQSGTVD